MKPSTHTAVVHPPRAGRRLLARPGVLGWLGVLAALVLPACGGDGGTGPVPPPAPPPPPPPGGSVTIGALAVGETVVINDPLTLRSFTLPGASTPREYRIALQSASEQGGVTMSAQFKGRVASATASAGAVRGAYGYSAPSAHGRAGLGQEEIHEFEERHRSWVETVRLQERVRGELRRVGARAASPTSSVVRGAASARLASVPTAGETLEFILPVAQNLTLSCENTENVIQAEVRSVGENFLIARDTQGPDAFTDSEYAQIQDVLDNFVHRVGTEYFGETADLDRNDRVIVLVTEEVNKLSDLEGKLIFLGFFLPSDVATKVDCPASNEAEILYVRAPDPKGNFGNETSVLDAIRFLQSTTSHEFQHLINAEQRFVLGSALFGQGEEVWLNEGLSHLAEELVGLAVAGLAVRANLGIDQLSADREAFNTYLLDNFINLGITADTPEGCSGWMVNPEGSVSLIVSDPPGCGTITMRGWAYLFLRWLGDQEGPPGAGAIPGSNEQALFRELVTGGPTHLVGPTNVERAVSLFGSGASWQELMADYLLMPAVDDLPEPALPTRSQLLTLDMRSLFRGLHENRGTASGFPLPYPLTIEDVLFGNLSSDFSIRASSAKYFTLLSTTTTPDYEIRITDQAGQPLPASRRPQLTLVRLR